ncbi:hypothetical protein LCGC14_1368670 [marine sediment metagenome]|uniref:DUF3307 domain-containing protein n=1 Tax=marine sediment metagenome TaxID=412755 RepID=A0A0F9K6E1_9ZZZZ
MIIKIMLLWFAHCLGDMVFQSNFMAEYKNKFWYAMFSHVFIWTMCVSLVLHYFGIFTYWKFIFLFVGHWIMDMWKSKQPKDDEHRWCMYVDQGWHLTQVIAVGVL